MESPQEKFETTVEKQPKAGQFTKNDPRINREGRPVGSKDFSTDFDDAVEELAKEEGITLSQARKDLLKVAYKHAKHGNYSFYKDIHDRIYGQATNKTDLTSGGEKLQVNIVNYAPDTKPE